MWFAGAFLLFISFSSAEGLHSECAKYEYVTDSRKPLYVKVLSDDCLQLLFRKESAVTLGLFEMDFHERVFSYPFVDQGKLGYLFQILQIFDRGILGAFLFHLDEMFKARNEVVIDIFKGMSPVLNCSRMNSSKYRAVRS